MDRSLTWRFGSVLLAVCMAMAIWQPAPTHAAKRAALYQEAQRRIMRDAVCLPLADVPNIWARNPKRVSTPFSPES